MQIGAATVHPLRTELAALQAATEELRRTAKHDLTRALQLLGQGPLAAHAPLRPGIAERNRVLAQVRVLDSKLEELKTVLETMRVDITKRRVKPSVVRASMRHSAAASVTDLDVHDGTRAGQAHLRAFGFELSAWREAVTALETTLQQGKPRWKKEWEAEVQGIVSEQRAVKDAEATLDDYEETRDNLATLYEQLTKARHHTQSGCACACDFVSLCVCECRCVCVCVCVADTAEVLIGGGQAGGPQARAAPVHRAG
jgi:chromosome segregation ATPase